MEYFIYPPVILLGFFLLYTLCRNDFVLLRQNIAASQIFDTLFMSLVSSFLFGRAFYMINNFRTELIGIFPFFHIVKYPGLSVFGIFFGGAVCFYLVFMKKKGLGRIADIFAISFLPLFAVSLFFEDFGKIYYSVFGFLILSIILFVFFLYSHNKYILRDGSIALLFAIFMCITTFVNQYFGNAKDVLFSFSFLAILSLVLGPPALVLFILNQRKKTS